MFMRRKYRNLAVLRSVCCRCIRKIHERPSGVHRAVRVQPLAEAEPHSWSDHARGLDHRATDSLHRVSSELLLDLERNETHRW